MKKICLSIFAMRRVLFFITALCWSVVTQAQQATAAGMQFEHAVSWEAVIAKAKQQNKLVFVDCYTTWCGPCKMMSSQVFTKKEVGDFYNAHYINVKVQMDSTAKDDDYTKSWYKYASNLSKQYKLPGYPTYLIFNGDGQLVHRFLGSVEPPEFIERGRAVLDPENQYYVQLRKYEAGDKSPAFLLKLIKLAQSAYEKDMESRLITEYLPTQTDLFTKENLTLLYRVAKTTEDKGFKIAAENGEKADRLLGGEPGRSRELVTTIILAQELPPLLKAEHPDFTKMEAALKVKCPLYAPYVANVVKMNYCYSKEQWDGFVKYVDEIVVLEGDKLGPKDLNKMARITFEKVNDPALLEKAVNWSRASLKKEEKAAYMDTYANLLYKTGKIKEGVEQEKRALELAQKEGGDTKWYKENLSKMEKGEPTWKQ